MIWIDGDCLNKTQIILLIHYIDSIKLVEPCKHELVSSQRSYQKNHIPRVGDKPSKVSGTCHIIRVFRGRVLLVTLVHTLRVKANCFFLHSLLQGRWCLIYASLVYWSQHFKAVGTMMVHMLDKQGGHLEWDSRQEGLAVGPGHPWCNQKPSLVP